MYYPFYPGLYGPSYYPYGGLPYGGYPYYFPHQHCYGGYSPYGYCGRSW